MLRAALTLALLSLSACEPHEISISACTAAGRLAFEVADTKGWFATTKPRPNGIMVYEPFVGPAWNVEVPYRLSEDGNHTYQPMRNILPYGIPLDGWDVVTKPQPLKFGVDYHVQIWSDGGRGEMDIKGGRVSCVRPSQGLREHLKADGASRFVRLQAPTRRFIKPSLTPPPPEQRLRLAPVERAEQEGAAEVA